MNPHDFPVHKFASKDFPFEIVRLDEIGFDDEEQMGQPHRHNYYEIFLFYKGGGVHRIDFNTYPIESNAIHFISPGQVHYIKRTAGCHGYVITFPQELFSLHDQQNMLNQLSYYHNYREPTLFTCSEKEIEGIKIWISKLVAEFSIPENKSEDLIRACLTVILLECNRMFTHYSGKEQEFKLNTGGNLILQFRQLLDIHYISMQQVQQYADLLGVTAGHLNDTIKKITGFTTSNHIHERLLLEAKRKLANTDLSAKEIAFDLNFEDPAYFGRFFRKYTGLSPVQFREQIRGKYQT